MNETTIRELKGTGDWDAVRSLPRVLVFKHSPICSVSAHALREVREYVGDGAVPVVQVDVIAHRDLSRLIAGELGVTHESPQVILLEGGGARWSASHFDITATELAARTRSEGSPP